MEDAVTGIVFVRGSPFKFLLVMNNISGIVFFPSSKKLDYESSHIETLSRILKQQVGLYPEDCTITKIPLTHELIHDNNKFDMQGFHGVHTIYIVETTRIDSIPSDENMSVNGWYSADEVHDKLLHDDAKTMFKKILKFMK